MMAAQETVAVGGDALQRGYRADIQGLRAVAVLLVVAYHGEFGLRGGFVGVDVFFVVSGFVITRLLMAELVDTGVVSFRRFYLRRIRRLLPALGMVLAVTLLLSTVLVPLAAQRVTARTGLGAALLNANTYLIPFGNGGGYFGLGAEANALLHMWSLSVEEQFYLVFPALVVLAWKVGSRRGTRGVDTLSIGLGAVAVGSFAVSLVLTMGWLDPGGYGAEAAFYSAPTRAWEFAAGALVAAQGARFARLSARSGVAVAWLGVALVAVAAISFDGRTAFPGWAALLPVVGTALLVIGFGYPGDSQLRSIVSVRPMQRIGDLSYSWYLWHWPLIVFAGALWPGSGVAKPVAAIVSLVPAWLSHRFLEEPIRRRASPAPGRTYRLAAVCMVVPVLAAGALEVTHQRLDATGRFAFELHADAERDCDREEPLGERDIGRCTWPVPDAAGTIVLVGDSNAGHFTEGFVLAANELGFDALVVTSSGCPFIFADVWDDGVEEDLCRLFAEGTVDELVALRPDLVVIASASSGYIEFDRFELALLGDAERSGSPDEKQRVWQAGLETVLGRFAEGGIPAMIVHPIPRLDESWNPTGWPPLRMFGLQSTRSRAESLAERTRAVEAELAAAAGRATVVDVLDEVCPDDQCVARDDDGWIYLDNVHLTVDTSIELADVFRRSMEVAVGVTGIGGR